MKEIEINSKKYGTHKVLVDDEDYEELSKYKWYLSKGKHTFYVHMDDNTYEKGVRIKRVTVLMHRSLMGVPKGDKRIVDHIDGNGMNNQKSNLRICTVTENNRNQVHSRGDFSSQYKGVYWCKDKKLWATEIRINKKKKFLGRFKSQVVAARTYDIAALKYFGEFHHLNFKTDEEYLEAKKNEIIYQV
jgi:hypothetical protein